MTETELNEWAERIWAAIEYGGSSRTVMRQFIGAYEASKPNAETD